MVGVDGFEGVGLRVEGYYEVVVGVAPELGEVRPGNGARGGAGAGGEGEGGVVEG